MAQKILILGGYGNAGLLIARLLLQETNVRLVISGRDLNRANKTADALNREFQTDRVSGRQADAASTNSLDAAFAGVDMILVASSTLKYVHQVCVSALQAGADYMDIQLSSPEKLAVLYDLQEQIEKKERCFITDGGFHPGVPAAMVRYAAVRFDMLETAHISGAFQLNWKAMQFSESTTTEFIDELKNFNPLVFKNKKWGKMSMMAFPKIDFGEPFGVRYCSPMFLEEMRMLPDVIPALKETGFYISGFNWMTDYLIMPVAFVALNLFGNKAKRPMGRLFAWGLKNFSKAPFKAILQLEAKGLKDKKDCIMHMKLAHDDAYVLTTVPVVACLLQYLNGNIRRPGLWFQANLVESKQFFKDMERLGIRIIIQIK